jgi:hypothetical protein
MMSLEPFELRDHHLAGRDQDVVVLVGKALARKVSAKRELAAACSGG